MSFHSPQTTYTGDTSLVDERVSSPRAVVCALSALPRPPTLSPDHPRVLDGARRDLHSSTTNYPSPRTTIRATLAYAQHRRSTHPPSTSAHTHPPTPAPGTGDGTAPRASRDAPAPAEFWRPLTAVAPWRDVGAGAGTGGERTVDSLTDASALGPRAGASCGCCAPRNGHLSIHHHHFGPPPPVFMFPF